MGCSFSNSSIYDETSLFTRTINIPSLSSLQDLCGSDKSQLTKTSSLGSYMLSGTYKHRIEPLKRKDIAYYFDAVRKQFVCYDFSRLIWFVNSLMKSTLRSTKNRNIDLDQDLFSQFSDYNSIAIDDNKIELIGPLHFQYEINTNCFSIRTNFDGGCAKAPCIASTGRKVFAMSGERNNEYVKTTAFYDLNTKEWHQLHDLPSPHGKGLSCCFLSDQQREKVLVIGGYSQKHPLIPSSNTSIYDVHEKEWKVVSFPKLITRRLPPLTEGFIYVSNENTIHIQLTKQHKDHYELNLSKGRLTKLSATIQTIENKDLEILKISAISNGKIAMLLASKESVDPSLTKLNHSRLFLSKKLFPDYYTISSNYFMNKTTQLVSLPKNISSLNSG